MSSFNLPPGCTTAMIDRAFGGDDAQDAPYLVDVPGNIYFEPVSHISLKSAKRNASAVGGVVEETATGKRLYAPCTCGDYHDAEHLRQGRCPECTLAALNTAGVKPEPAWVNDARAWLRDIGANAGLPFVGAALKGNHDR